MSRSQSDSKSTRGLLSILLRHRKKTVLTFLLGSAVVVLAVVAKSDRYPSESKMLMRVGRESVTLDPTATLGQVISVSRSGQSEINTLVGVLKSRDLVEKVVDTIGPNVILDADDESRPGFVAAANGWLDGAKKFLRDLGRDGDTSDSRLLDEELVRRSDAVDLLMKNTEIWAPRESTVVSLKATAASPKLAQQIVKEWSNAFLQEHLRLTHTERSHPFFVDQRDLMQEKLRAAQDKLLKAKNLSEISSIDGQRTLLELLKSEIDVEQFRTSRQISSAEASCKELKASLATLPETILSERKDGIADQGHDAMRLQLYMLEIKERELLEVYADKHPLIRVVKAQVEAVRRILEEQADTVQHKTYAANPAREELKLDFYKEEVRLATLRASGESLGRQHTEIVKRIQGLNEYAVTIDAMQRDVDQLNSNYQLYVEKSEQARINDAMTEDQITSIQIVQAASITPKPAGPSRAALLVMGMIAAMIGAGGVAVLAESLAPNTESAREKKKAPQRVVPSRPESVSRQTADREKKPLPSAEPGLVGSGAR